MDSSPLWLEAKRPEFAPLKTAGHYDAIVVGGGITGLTAAYLLKQSGRRVCVLEKGTIGGGESGHTSAHLTAAFDMRLQTLASRFGDGVAQRIWQAGAVSIDLIETLVHRHDIGCEFQRIPGFLHADPDNDKSERDHLQQEYEVAHRLGVPAHFVDSLPLVGKPAVAFADQARFHPAKYLAGLAEQIPGDGCEIFEKTSCDEVQSDPLAVLANQTRLTCDFLVLATHVPLSGKSSRLGAAQFQTKFSPYSTYVIAARIAKGRVPDALYWDTHEPYHYLRIVPGAKNDIVILGGADHKTGQKRETEECFQKLERHLERFLPGATVDRRWSGQVVETHDGLPLIGFNEDQQFVATGYSGNGLTFGTLAAIMAVDAVDNHENPWQDILSPTRTTLRKGAWEYLTENLDYPRYLIGDWLTRGLSGNTRNIKRGEGRIVHMNGQRVACSRDDDGTLHQVSATCTHMGCLVRWNEAEATWDCPCHGSRFAANGEVISGPAESPLSDVTKSAKTNAKGSDE